MSVEFQEKQQSNSIGCKVITVSDTRDKDTDKSGRLIIEKLQADGHLVTKYEIVKDEQTDIKQAILAGCHDQKTEAVIINGGTGIAMRDVTIETVKPLLDKEMVGFGEIFRMLSYTEDIGSAAILSRAIAGVVNETAVFAVPGSSGAVKLAMDRLILSELSHVVYEVNK